jgi:serine/threonine-protein kinase
MHEDRVGELIGGRYELLGVVARGGYSVVYRARDRASGRQVAVKRLDESVASDPEFSERLQREYRAMAALVGTGAVRVEDLCSADDGSWCLVMELLEGCDFDDYLALVESRGERLRLDELLAILSPIVDTLEAAHRGGIVHRDLKPGNIFVVDAKTGLVRLLDFGLAKVALARPLTRGNMVIGSPSYIAPEVWSALDTADHRVDIYSLGAVIFRALAGRAPFQGSLRDKIELVTRGPRPSLYALRHDLPRDVDVWVQQALAIDPERRFYHVRAMWTAFCDLVADAARGPELALARRLRPE